MRKSGAGLVAQIGAVGKPADLASSPLAAKVLNRLKQSALAGGPVLARVAGQFWLAQFRAALCQSFAERRKVNPATGPFRMSL